MSHPSEAETRRAWTRIWEAARLDQEHATGEYARARSIRDRYLAAIPPGARILEAGCGVGTELIALAHRGRRAVGVDYVVPALAALKTVRADAPVAAADIHALPFCDGAFDAYLSFGVLEHFEGGALPALREARRVLSPGGVIVLTVPAPNLVWRYVEWRQRRRAAPRRAEYFETTYSPVTLADAVRRAGFVDIVTEPIGHAFTLWGLGRPFRGPGHYETSARAERVGRWAARLAPEMLAFATLLLATAPSPVASPARLAR